ncbi:hypothetical protein [Salinivibrio proteolyticus]|uniref:Uncharacterized protein n=1 Tax=Salinivibrio proteolyticus TaxID=334715 RepID=A0ABY7L9E8_9GAMM|nr:hypothetical protein [Salinivibrio proteolyticus]WBA13878.1 hypothetical protein N7E60_09060 [Salinivibrio proteolyticus]
MDSKNDQLYDLLLCTFGTEANIAKAFDVERATHWKRKVPERVALLCHLSEAIPYRYDPIQYGRNMKGLKLVLEKQTTNEVTTNDQTIHSAAA